MARRIGRDRSIIPLMVGPVGIGIPKWLALVLLYFGVVFALAWSEDAAGRDAATIAAAIGPGVIGFVDLVLRLRTTHYEWLNPAGGLIVTPASLVDRLSLRECGWYFPLVSLPLPLWLVGGAVSASFARSWGLV